MASLLNNASLLLNPAGSIIAYEEDKIFSVLPSNGAGDFTFSGGDGGTRVNQQGYIESTPANLVLNSEIFSSGWNLGATTITSNSVIAPNGTLTADSFQSNSGVANHVVYQFISNANNGTYTFSCYVKKVNSRYIELKIVGTAVDWVAAVFDLDTATVTKSQASNWTSLNTTITNIGDGWYKFSISGTGTVDSNFNVGIQYVDSATPTFNVNYADVSVNGSGVVDYYIWGAMLNLGSTARPYQPTTDRLNYPRITYQNGRGALLSEPQRTNLTQGSNGLTTNWTNYRGTYTANAISSPDGTTNAPLTVWDGSSPNSVGFYFQNFSFAGSTAYCFSVFLKYYNKDIVNLGYADRSNPYLGGDVDFNIANGTVGTVRGDATKGIIEPYKDGWYRCTIVFTSTASPSFNYIAVGADGVTTGQGFYIYGSQFEVGSFPTSYIPTTSATVTRPADISSDTSATSVIGQTAGTLYSNFTWLGPVSNVDSPILSLGDQSYGNSSIVISTYNSGLYGRVTNGISADANINFGTMTPGVQYKCALAYANNDVQFFVNGVNYGQDTGVSIPAIGSVYLQNSFPNSKRISTSALFTSRLTNTQLAELTTVNSGSGGNISYYGPYTIHTFTGSATFTPSFSGQVEVLVVAGGGGTGYDVGGGGGGGGVIYTSAYGVTAGTGITVTIGAGGTSGQTASTAGGNGGNSVFGGLNALGGGGGGTYPSGQVNGLDGGSGGGAGNANATGGSGSIGQGYNGGNSSATWGSGGGGGAAGNGANGIQNQTVLGGLGATYSISGFSTTYSGGGFGAFDSQTLRPTGQDSNGLTLGYYGYGANGTGLPNNSPYIGNQGIVIVRYLT